MKTKDAIPSAAATRATSEAGVEAREVTVRDLVTAFAGGRGVGVEADCVADVEENGLGCDHKGAEHGNKNHQNHQHRRKRDPEALGVEPGANAQEAAAQCEKRGQP